MDLSIKNMSLQSPNGLVANDPNLTHGHVILDFSTSTTTTSTTKNVDKKRNPVVSFVHDNNLIPVEMAAVLIQMAYEGQEEFRVLFHTSLARRCFHLHYKYKFILQIISILLIILTFIERPWWTYKIDNWNR